MFSTHVKSKYSVVSTATPWGASQSTQKVLSGLTWYSTEGHGGLCISMGLANKKLTANARAHGIKYAGSYWYEEDSSWVIPVYENPEWAKTMLEKGIFASLPTMAEMKARIEQYTPDYFTAGHQEIIDFKDLKIDDLLYIDKIDSEPYVVMKVEGNNAVIARHGTHYKWSKSSYFSRVKKVARDGKSLTK